MNFTDEVFQAVHAYPPVQVQSISEKPKEIYENLSSDTEDLNDEYERMVRTVARRIFHLNKKDEREVRF